MAIAPELQAAEADAERRRQEELYAILTQPSYQAPQAPADAALGGGWLDVGTDEPVWVSGPGYVSGGREGFVEAAPDTSDAVMFGWADTPLSYWQQQSVAPDVLSDENILRYGRAYQYLRENPETVYDPNSEFRRQLAVAGDLVNQFNVAIPNKSSSFGQGLVRGAGGMLRNLSTNPVVMAALTAGLSTPAIAGGQALLTPLQAGVATGALSGAASSQNPCTGALRGGVIGGATVGAGQYARETVGGMFPDSPWLGGIARGGAGALTGAVLSGAENPWMAGAQGALMGGLSAYGSPTPSLSDQDFDALMGELDALMVQPEAPIQLASAGNLTAGMLPGMTFGTSYLDQPGFLGAPDVETALAETTSPVSALEGLAVSRSRALGGTPRRQVRHPMLDQGFALEELSWRRSK